MKKIIILLMFVVLILTLFGCSDGIGLSDNKGVGELLIKDVKLEGKIYKDNIDRVIVKGEFSQWGEIEMHKGNDNLWRLDFADINEEQYPEPGNQYGFVYWSTEAGVPPDSNPYGIWMDHATLSVAEGQDKFVFVPEEMADLSNYINNGNFVVDNKEYELAKKVNLLASSYTVTINTSVDDINYSGKLNEVCINPGETTLIEKVILSKPEIVWRFTFVPETYGLTAEEVETVHLAGEMNGWNTDYDNCSYQLVKQSNDTWVGEFSNVSSGQLFNFLVYKTNSDEELWCPGGMGNNLTVDEETEGVEKMIE